VCCLALSRPADYRGLSHELRLRRSGAACDNYVNDPDTGLLGLLIRRPANLR
jgi:hypothetical protein